jgi:anaerobic magnesium-protoporphyrin IX monomethyl ester cyclase
MDYSLESDFVIQLDQDILEFIYRGLEGEDEDRFAELAMREFELQYNTIEPYRKYCKNKDVSPKSVTSWDQIPAVPSMAFKKFALASFPVEKAEHAYFTSGTSNPAIKGKIFRDAGAVRLIKEANGLLTRSYLFPDEERMKILLMVPSPKMVRNMGMAIGLEEVRKRFGTPDSRYLISPLGLNLKALLAGLKESESSGEPIALIGATSGFIYFFKACEKDGVSFKLPKGSRICDGGGYLGQFGECTKQEYFAKCEKVLGIKENYCVNVLGMGESSTNYFDNVLRNFIVCEEAPRCKEVPPWTRTIVVDTKEFKRVSKGEIGLLRHYDLANRAMVCAVQTDNLGFETEYGFEIIGRWNKELGAVGIDYSATGHPGGKIVTQMTDFLMRRSLSGIGRIYSRLKR